MDGPRSRGYGARSGYDVRTRCIRGCTERRQGVSPGRIRHETEAARFCVGRVAESAQQFKATRSASTESPGGFSGFCFIMHASGGAKYKNSETQRVLDTMAR